MREIKFRAWDIVNNKMQHSGIVWGYSINLKYKDIRFPVLEGFDYGDNINNLSNLMQYTGLKDKNGKEIYEGDIVKANINNVVSIGKVVYIDDWAMFQTEFTIGNIGRYSCYEDDEVIGNIYENPELLDKD